MANHTRAGCSLDARNLDNPGRILATPTGRVDAPHDQIQITISDVDPGDSSRLTPRQPEMPEAGDVAI